MKILVTGGAGFIASWIVDEYIRLGHKVVVIDNLSTGNKRNLNKEAVFYNVDIRDREKVKNVFQKERPEVLNHHAAQMDVRKSVADPVFDCQVNLIGLLNLLEEGRLVGLKKVIFASSGGAVYGDASMIPTSEEYNPLMPLSPYGVAKLASEHYLYFYCQIYGISYVALRYGNVYGPRQNPFGEAGVVAIFTKKILNNEQPVINGDGKNTRDYVYVADIARANVLALENKINSYFNIGTSIETDVNTMFLSLIKIISSETKEVHGPEKQGEQRRSCLAISKAKKILGWEPKVKMDQGLAQTVDFFRRNNG